MKYVVDTSASIFFLGLEDGPHFSHLKSFPLLDIAHEDNDFFVPNLFYYEVSNYLMRKIKRKIMAKEVIQSIFYQLEQWDLKMVALDSQEEHQHIIALALKNPTEHRGVLSHYDASYLYLTKKLDALLLTADRKLLKIAGRWAYQ